jgi:hypothetical protein
LIATIFILSATVTAWGGRWSPARASKPTEEKRPTGRRAEPQRAEPQRAEPQRDEAQHDEPQRDEGRSSVRFFLSTGAGLVWWHHHDPPVVARAHGKVGLHWELFEIGAGFGSPAFAQLRSRGLYEFFVDFSFISLSRSRWRLRHQLHVGLLAHNPPFELHDFFVTARLDFGVVAFRLYRSLWVELSPLSIAMISREQLSSFLSVRYEL